MSNPDAPSPAPSIAQQAAAVARAAVNWRGHVDNLANLVGRNKRPQSEYEMAAKWLPDLEAAAETMKKLAAESREPPAQGALF